MTITTNADHDNTQQTKKKSKSKKNKSKLTSKCDNDNVTEHSNNDAGRTVGAVCEREVQAVSEELLKRLQINGSGDNGIADEASTVNGKVSPTAQKAATMTAKGMNSANKSTVQAKHNNNNNNINCKDDHGQSKCAVNEMPCNGVSHEASENDAAVAKAKAAAGATPNETLISNESNDITEVSKANGNAATTKSPPALASETPKILAAADSQATTGSAPSSSPPSTSVQVTYKEYESELQMPDIMRVIQRELSEPYSIYTYRYFIHNWPKLCFLAMHGDHCVGAIVCKLDIHRQVVKRGYIAMLAVEQSYRKLKVGTTLVQKAIEVSDAFHRY